MARPSASVIGPSSAASETDADRVAKRQPRSMTAVANGSSIRAPAAIGPLGGAGHEFETTREAGRNRRVHIRQRGQAMRPLAANLFFVPPGTAAFRWREIDAQPSE